MLPGKDAVAIGVIGVGHLGSLHTKILKQIPQARLVGVYDRDPSRAASVAREYRTEAFPTADALLEKVEAVSIATPTVKTRTVGSMTNRTQDGGGGCCTASAALNRSSA